MATHQLKIQEKWFERILSGEKTCEVRRNDRDYQTGDIIEFMELAVGSTDMNGDTFGTTTRRITHVLTHDVFPDGVPHGYCVLSLGDD